MADAQKLYKLELAEAEKVTGGAKEALKDFLDSLNFGSSSPYSLRDQESQVLAKLQPMLDQIARGEGVDSEAYRQLASQYLDIERQIYGSTGQYFEQQNRIQAATAAEISRIDNATPIRTIADPFAEATATNTAQANNLLADQNDLLRQVVAQLSSGASLGSVNGFIGATARNFAQ